MKYKKELFYTLILLFAVLAGTAIYFKKELKLSFIDEVEDRSFEKPIGVYDRNSSLKSDVTNASHILVKWKTFGLWLNEKLLKRAVSEHTDLLITIETWPSFSFQKNDVLKNVLKGGYDNRIKAMAKVLALSKGNVFIRWNPEMEVPVHQFPWQYQPPILYIDAFNHFASHLKKLAPNVKIVWSPAGYPGDSEFWPDKDNVDAISILFGGQSEILSSIYPVSHISISDQLKLKLHRLRFMDKPVLVLSADSTITSALTKDIIAKVAANIQKYKNTVYSAENFEGPYQARPSGQKLVMGVFDPNKKLLAEPEISIEHLFTDWGEIERGQFLTNFNDVVNRKHDVIITMEPWRDTTNVEDKRVLLSTVEGKYDKQIAKLYKIISNTKQTVYLRWAHEMEIPIHRYLWQSQDPVDYINSFRYFMNFPKGMAKNIKRVWGPAGDRGSADWYPGNDVVDYVSIAIYGLPDKNIIDENKQESFSDIFQRKSYRMRFIDKPIFITEFGVKGSATYQDKWLVDAANTILTNPQIAGICYFNLYDNPKAWGHIEAPDWSISKKTLKKFSLLLGNKINRPLK